VDMRVEYGAWLEEQGSTMVQELHDEAKTKAQMLDELDSECCPLCLLPLHEHAEISGGMLLGADGENEADSLVVTTLCNHRFHLGCLRRSRQIATQGDSCPMCRQPLASGLTPRGRARWAKSLSGSGFTARRTARSHSGTSRVRVRSSAAGTAGWSTSTTFGALAGDRNARTARTRASRTSTTTATTRSSWRRDHQRSLSSTAAAAPPVASLRPQAPAPPESFLRQQTFDASMLGGL
jgi:hypothetical protein